MPLHKLGVEGGCVRVVPGVRNLVWSRSELGGVVLMPGPWVHPKRVEPKGAGGSRPVSYPGWTYVNDGPFTGP